MHLQLDEIGSGGITREYRVQGEDFPEIKQLVDDGQLVLETPILFWLRLQRAGLLVELDGRVDFTVRHACGRCLGEFAEPVSFHFAVTFSPRKDEKQDPEEETELEADELNLIPYDGDRIELQDTLQEQVLLSLPFSPLCQDSCRGLCIECGANLNQGDCTCEKRVFNNKFSALKNLKIES